MGPKCRGCQRTAASKDLLGWYNLTVNVPVDINPRKYIWLGIFCSLACLARHMPDLRLQQLATEDLYERTPAKR